MFVDTNVLVYARVLEAPNHDLARELLGRAMAGGEPVQLSRHVLREYLAVMTRPQTWPVPVTREEVLQDVERLAANVRILEDGPVVTEALVALCRDVPAAGKQIHDANIVATMLVHGVRQLLTFNAADFQRYGGRVEVLTGDLGSETQCPLRAAT